MKRHHFRTALSLSVIAVHAMCLGLIWFGKDQYLSPTQKIDVALLFMPITAAYVVSVVKSAIQEQYNFDDTTRVNINYVLVVGLFSALALGGLLLTALNLEGNAEVDRQQILLFGIAFGAAFGLIAADLFGTGTTNQETASNSNKP